MRFGLAALLVLCGSCAAHEPATVLVGRAAHCRNVPTGSAWIDTEAGAQLTKEGREAMRILQQKFSRSQAELDKQRAVLSDRQSQLELESREGSETPAFRAKAAVLNEDIRKLQETYVQMQHELDRESDERGDPIIEGLIAEAAQLASERGYACVLRGPLTGSVDLTRAAVRRYDARPVAASPARTPASEAPTGPSAAQETPSVQ